MTIRASWVIRQTVMHQGPCVCVMLMLLFHLPESASVPSVVYIAQLGMSPSQQPLNAVESAIRYVNKRSDLLPSTTIKLLQETYSKDNLLQYALNLSSYDVIALLVDAHPQPSQQAMSAMFRIPMVTLHEAHTYTSQTQSLLQYGICVGPSGYDVTRAMNDVITHLNRNKILVLYDGRWRSQAMLFISRLPSNSSYSKMSLEIESDSWLCGDTKELLGRLNNAPTEVIALFCDSYLVAEVIDKVHCACSFKVEKPHIWLIADMIPSVSMPVQSSQVVLGFLPQVTDSYLTRHIDRELNLSKTAIYNSVYFAYDAVLATAHALDKVILEDRWVSLNRSHGLTTSLNGPSIFEEMKKLKINSTTGILDIAHDGSRRNLELEVFNLQNDIFTKIGVWSASSGVTVSGSVKQNRPTTDLVPLDKLHRKLEVVVVLDSPFVMLNEAGVLEGFSIDLIKEISQMLGFAYNVYLSPDGLYGGSDGLGGYTGIVGQIIKGKADLSTSPLTITSERLQYLEFSKPFMQFTMSLISKKFDNDNQYLMAFMRPYSSTVWLLTLAGLLLVTILMFVVNYISPYGYRKSHKSKNGEAFNFFNSLWFCLASMLQQGADSTPRSLSGRVLAGCFWFCILIWISTYTANLAAFFTVRSAGKTVSTLEDVVDGGYHFYIIRHTALYHFFKMASYHTYRKLWERMSAEKTFVNSTNEGYEVARKRKNAVFMAEKPSTEYTIMREPCDLQAASGLMGASSYGMAMPKHYPYIGNISVAILRLHETGVLDSLWRKWWDYRSQCPKEQTRSAIGTGKQIDLDSMVGVYVVLATGGIASVILVMCEIWWSRHGNRVKAHFKSKFGTGGTKKNHANDVTRMSRIEQYKLVSPSPTGNDQFTTEMEKRWPSDSTNNSKVPVVRVTSHSRTTDL